MSKNTINYLTQLDYMKTLIEDNRVGEALNYISNLSIELDKECNDIAANLAKSDIIFTREQLKTRIGNFIQVDNVWCKIINKSNFEIELEISKGISVLKKNIKKQKQIKISI